MRPILVVAALGLLSCGHHGVRAYVEEPFPVHLSDWRLFTGTGTNLKPAAGVLPYDLNTPLFSDYADKNRFVWMPSGKSARYRENDTFEFPHGAVLAKTFFFSGKRIETRLLVNTKNGWVGLPYVWNAEQTDATLEIVPDPVAVEYRHASGEVEKFDYVIPNSNQCMGCHENSGVMEPIGPKTRHLNKMFDYPDGRENQLARWSKAGYLEGVPESPPRAAVWNDPSTGSLGQRARAYIDINCGHCHNPRGPANTTGLKLTVDETSPAKLGYCKTPVAAGQGSGNLLYAIVPGKPEESFMIYRLKSVAPKVAMPELGRATVHREGVALLEDWIRSLRGSCNTGT